MIVHTFEKILISMISSKNFENVGKIIRMNILYIKKRKNYIFLVGQIILKIL